MSICDSQDDFNSAFRKAVKYTNKENMKKAEPWMAISGVVLMIFLIWALMLAMKLPPGPQKTEHLLFAILFSPIYVLAYYLSA